MKDTIRVYPDQAGQYRWHRRAGNNEIIAQGESHPRMADAKRAAERANPDTEWDWAPDNGWDRHGEYADLHRAHADALRAAYGDSNDDEIAAWREVAELATALLPGYTQPDDCTTEREADL